MPTEGADWGGILMVSRLSEQLTNRSHPLSMVSKDPLDIRVEMPGPEALGRRGEVCGRTG